MSILIKGMEMPTSCLRGGCQIFECSLWEGKFWNSPDEPYHKRHPKCPLVPVPPHGRLIDADALSQNYRYDDYDEAVVDCEDIDNAPTVIEAEVDDG